MSVLIKVRMLVFLRVRCESEEKDLEVLSEKYQPYNETE